MIIFLMKILIVGLFDLKMKKIFLNIIFFLQASCTIKIPDWLAIFLKICSVLSNLSQDNFQTFETLQEVLKQKGHLLQSKEDIFKALKIESESKVIYNLKIHEKYIKLFAFFKTILDNIFDEKLTIEKILNNDNIKRNLTVVHALVGYYLGSYLEILKIKLNMIQQ